jgi:hypothetical protein
LPSSSLAIRPRSSKEGDSGSTYTTNGKQRRVVVGGNAGGPRHPSTTALL